MDKEIVRKFLNKRNVIAVVGASRDPKKYGNYVYRELKKAGYRVYPMNPSSEKILGDKSFPSLGDLPIKPDVVDIVVPPAISKKVVRDCVRLGIKNVWMQPGSESDDVIKFCMDNGISVVHGSCIVRDGIKTQKIEHESHRGRT
ncbi:MAG: CoA-binding protein [Candidatus Bathyarchaeia archaeon]